MTKQTHPWFLHCFDQLTPFQISAQHFRTTVLNQKGCIFLRQNQSKLTYICNGFYL